MYLLYDCLQSGGVFVKAGLEEAGVAYRQIEVDIRKGANFDPEYSRINPRQQVPSLLVQNRGVLTEGVAIMLYISDQHPEAGLLPKDKWERGQAIRWLLFLATNVYEGSNRLTRPERYTSDPTGIDALKEANIAFVNRQYEIFEDAVSHTPYFFGPSLSLVDLYIWMLAQWHEDVGWLRKNCPKTIEIVETVMRRKKVAPIHTENFLPEIGLKPIPINT